jgi:5-methylcytosine-specific restriction endonuclease McrA
MKFYKSSKWRKKRELVLRRDNYLCQECRRYGKTTPAQTVHHIYPLERYPVLALVSANLVSLCNECHERMHDRLTGELTQTGERWRDRVSSRVRNALSE